MKLIQLYEQFDIVNKIIKVMQNIDFKLFKNTTVTHPYVFYNPDFKYEYGINKNNTKVDVLNKKNEIVDTYPIDEFSEKLEEYGIDLIKTNHDNIDSNKV